MSPHQSYQTIEAHGCAVALRRFNGPLATELFLHCAPQTVAVDAGHQAEAIYRAILDALATAGGQFASIVTETVFLRALPANLKAVRDARDRVLSDRGAPSHRPAVTEIEQPPLSKASVVEVSVHAVLPHGSPLQAELIETGASCDCGECAHVHGLRVRLGDEVRFHAGGLCGHGHNAHEQTLAMFSLAEDLLRGAGMTFADVARTWIYLRDIDRDYDSLNRARREFFEARGIDPVPASTGIGGAAASGEHDLSLGLYAVAGARGVEKTVMTSPTLNEAAQYGADFVRGMRLAEANRTALNVSGTASIDEHGATAHVGDLEAQAQRMLVNIRSLLAEQNAGFGNIVSAITYLKHPQDAASLRAKLSDAGFDGFPHALVAAPVCRPDLLCESEVLALLPADSDARLPG